MGRQSQRSVQRAGDTLPFRVAGNLAERRRVEAFHVKRLARRGAALVIAFYAAIALGVLLMAISRA